ncbi:hypothetical protein INR49_017980 [Caranx melampygus]|nr:hypothetical protein INR49_017980 [Caranx melampygus]
MFLCDLPSSQKHHKEQAGRSSSDYIPQTESWITLRAGRWPQQRGGVTVQHHRLTLQRDSGIYRCMQQSQRSDDKKTKV